MDLRPQLGGRVGWERRFLDTGEMVPVAPLREAFRRSGVGLRELARRLDWHVPDQNRAGRALGIHKDGHTHRAHEYISYDTAVRICEVLDIDPVDAGI